MPPVRSTSDRRGRAARIAAGSLAAAVLLWWFIRGVDLQAMLGEIRRARVEYIAAAVALSLAGIGVRALRWRYLVAPFGPVPVRALAAAIVVGSAVTALLPGRLGEIARALFLRRRAGLRSGTAFGTIVLERLLDVLALLLLVAAALALAPAVALSSPHADLVLAIRAGALIVFGALVGIAAVGLAVHHVPDPVASRLRASIERLPGWFGRFGWRLGASFAAGLSGALTMAASPEAPARRLRAGIGGHTLLLWATICGVHALLFRAFDVDATAVQIPPLLFLITLGLSVPVPASLGSYHKAVQVGLTTMAGVSSETAAGYAIVSHAVTQLPPAIIGTMILAREGLTLSSLTFWPASTRSPDE
jgi:uncharacterized membrane protein YbhN (UPF0104 family)